METLIEYKHHQETNIKAKKAIQKMLREIATYNILSFKLNSLNKITGYTVLYFRQGKTFK
tara:strand:+ start:1156 stop:1335 length:180 start_codon:yes stop_codon:yes gene_type:complete